MRCGWRKRRRGGRQRRRPQEEKERRHAKRYEKAERTCLHVWIVPRAYGTHAGGLVAGVRLGGVLEIRIRAARAVDAHIARRRDVRAAVGLRHHRHDSDARRRAHRLRAQPRQQRPSMLLRHGLRGRVWCGREGGCFVLGGGAAGRSVGGAASPRKPFRGGTRPAAIPALWLRPITPHRRCPAAAPSAATAAAAPVAARRPQQQQQAHAPR